MTDPPPGPVGERQQREQITAARRHLGIQLAAWRKHAGMTQHALARRIGYSRGAIASAETGQPLSAAFWAAADHATNAGGTLTAQHAQIIATITAARRRAAQQAWHARAAAERALSATLLGHIAPAITDTACPRCGTPLTVTARITAIIPQDTPTGGNPPG